jgi:thioredoxin reductase (NADPH)
MEKVDYDLVIVGGGPAGLTSGLYAARGRMNAILIERIAPGGQMLATEYIENYPGFPERMNGIDLTRMMLKQAEHFGLKIENNAVLSTDLAGPIKKLRLSDRTISARAVIVASGAFPKKLGIPGEEAFLGRGVSYCSTCDAPFYRGRAVAAVGGGDTAVQESLFLTKFAEKVYLIHRRDRFRAEKILQERAFANEKIEIVWDTISTGIEGSAAVEGVSIRNVKTGEAGRLAVDGCFIWIGILPNSAFLDPALKLDPFGFIVADAEMATSLPGVFVAGDVRSTPLRQIATAVGDAAIAAHSAEHYIESQKA